MLDHPSVKQGTVEVSTDQQLNGIQSNRPAHNSLQRCVAWMTIFCALDIGDVGRCCPASDR